MLAAIVRDPGDLELRRVYADHLLERGDPRGDHIALAFEAAAGDIVAQARVRELERAFARDVAAAHPEYVVRATWRCGFVERLAIVARDPGQGVADLAPLLARPACAAMSAFDPGDAWLAEPFADAFEEVAELVAAHPIRWIAIGPGAIGARDVAAVFARLPKLVGLGLTTSEPDALDALADRANLADVALAVDNIPPAPLVRRILQVLPPTLERLVIGEVGGLLAPVLAPILDGTAFPALRHFGVFGSDNTTAQLVKKLAKSKLLPRLASLGFAADQLDEATTRWLGEHAAAFAHVALFTHPAGAEALGWLLKRFGRHADAIPELAHHLDVCGALGSHRHCREEVGEAMLEAGRPAEAIVPLEEDAKLFKQRVTRHSLPLFQTLGQTLDALGRFTDADALWKKVLRHGDADTGAWNRRWHARTLHGLGKLPAALALFDKSRAQARPELDGLESRAATEVERARVLWDLRRGDEAIAALAAMRTLVGRARDTEATTHVGRTPEDAARDGWLVEGQLARQRGDRARAKTCFLAAGAVGVHALGRLALESGDAKAALAAWERLPITDETIEDRAHALLALGRLDGALALVSTRRHEVGGARACAELARGDREAALAALADYARRPWLAHPVCTYRHAAAALVARRAGKPRGKLARACTSPACARAAQLAAVLADPARDTRALDRAIAKGPGGLLLPRLWELRAVAATDADRALIDRVELGNAP